MSTKAYYPINEIGAGKPGFSKTRSIIEAAFYGNNVVKVNTLKEAYELAKNSPGTIVTDMPVYRGEEFGLEKDAKVLLFNDGAVTGRYAAARRIKGEPGVDSAKLDKVAMDAIYESRWKTMYHAEVFVGLDPEFMVKAHLLIPEGEENIMYNWMLNFQYMSDEYVKMYKKSKPVGEGKEPDIYIGGSLEIRHLGKSIQNSYKRNEALMNEIVWEQNERRKSELDALQSQINPHFLYNTLDSITWMIEGERNDEATFMISQLARLFRISLSKGHTIISLKDELQHAKSYMNIQKVRYKNSFSVTFDVDEKLYSYCTVKLILQPLLENAINYGVSGMEDSGKIIVTGRMQEDKIILAVCDNGLGMPEEEAVLVLTDSNRVHKHGSGVGLVNVNSRIQIVFGKEYGLLVESEPDEGTRVSICIPAVPYTEENCKILEKGHIIKSTGEKE